MSQVPRRPVWLSINMREQRENTKKPRVLSNSGTAFETQEALSPTSGHTDKGESLSSLELAGVSTGLS